MALDPQTVIEIIKTGKELYDFINEVSASKRDDPFKAVLERLKQIENSINQSISRLGENVLKAIAQSTNQIRMDLLREQIGSLHAANAAINAYLTTYGPGQAPNPPKVSDGNYISARDRTLVAVTFCDQPQLDFMGGYVYAMNTRVNFITGLHCDWFQNSGYIDEIRRGIERVNGYIAAVKAGIDRQFAVVTKEKSHIEQSTEPPFTKPVRVVDSITFTVTSPTGTLWTKTVLPEDAAAARVTANSVRRQASLAKQTEVMGHYDNIVAKWNSLVAMGASAAIQRALLPRTEAPMAITTDGLAISTLRTIAPAGGAANLDAATEPNATPTYVVPLRDVLLQVLRSPEFTQRMDTALGGSDQRVVGMWFRKAFQREPSAEEAATLEGVMKLFGHKAFFSCLGYSREYEQRYGEGLPMATAA